MNFLLSAIDGHNDGDGFGDDGGWGSEEDIDLSDDEYDTETSGGYDTEAIPQHQPENGQGTNPAPLPQANSGTMRIGGGMLMGRLTQFLDTVAPQHQEDEGFSEVDGWADDGIDVDVDAGGWADDDIAQEETLSQLDDGDDPAAQGASSYAANNDISISTNQAVVAPVPPPPPPPPPPPQDAQLYGLPATADPSESFFGESHASSAAVGIVSTAGLNETFDAGNENNIGTEDGAGWDVDDGLLFDDEDNNDVVNVENVIEADVTFVNAPAHPKNSKSAPPPASLQPVTTDEDGWANDDGLLFDNDNIPEVGDVIETDMSGEIEAKSSQPPPPKQIPAPPVDNDNNGGDGWSDDEGFEFDDKDDEDVTNEKEMVPSRPPPPPKPLTAIKNDSNNENDQGNGWDYDDGIVFDDNDDEDVVEPDVAGEKDTNVSQLIPPPPPPEPSAPITSNSDDDCDGAGWDDDDNLVIDGKNTGEADFAVAEEGQPTETPQPPPPASHIGQADPSVSLGGETISTADAVRVASTDDTIENFETGNENDGADGSGWGDDDGLLDVAVDSDESVEKEIQTSQLTASIPPSPPPLYSTQANILPNRPNPTPPPPTINNNEDEGDGWDDDNALLLDGVGDNLADTEEVDRLQSSKTVPPPPPAPLPMQADPSVSLGGETLSTTDAVGTASATDFTNNFDMDSGNNIADGSGWGNDDNLLDDAVEDDSSVGKEIESSQLMDSTPSPPPVQDKVSGDNGLVNSFTLDNDDGWDDDDDLGINISDNFDADSATPASKNVVDHIPSPSPPRKVEDPATNDATDGDDDISQDDTLSIANSRSHQNAVGGLRTMSVSTFGDEDSESGAEVSAADVEPEAKHTETTVRTVPTFSSGSGRRKVVDFTPRRTRFSGNDSLMVSGHTSVGESLDSIDEADEEDYEDELDFDNAQNLRKLSSSIGTSADTSQEEAVVTPRTMEMGWGALVQQSHSTLSKSDLSSYEIPFGSGVTPTAANNITPSRFASIQIDNQRSNSPMVDHTPGVKDVRSESYSRKPSMATSIDVLGGSSEGDLGETDTVDVDDIKDELYGPMVDQIPPTPIDDSPTRRRRKMSSGQVSVGSTVVGQAENKDIQKDIHDDDAMDEEEVGEDGTDETSKGWGSTLEFDNRSLLSGLPLPVVDETEYLVDQVPVERLLRGGGASMMVMMDASMASIRAEDIVDGSNNANFGPIVDHTPSLSGPSRGAPSIATSVATAVSGLDGDIKEDDDMDNTTVAGGTIDSADPREDEELEKVAENHIVDHVPEGKGRSVNPDASIRVLVGKEDDLTQVDTIAEDVALDFGPIVDHTPLPTSRNTSWLSVEASFQAQRNSADDNNTATLGSVTEDDDNTGWDHDEPDLDDISASDQVVVSSITAKEENNLVDRIPRRSFVKPVDGSTIVLVDQVDAASEVDDADDDTAGNARVDKFGPVVDHTPAPRSAPVSLATSMANPFNGPGSENRPYPDIDGSATWFGASTLGGISSAAGDDDSGTGWDEGDLGDLASPVVPRPVQAPLTDHLVDHIPSLTSPRNLDTNASTAVAIDPSVLSNQTQDDKMGEGLFGAVVDHTPSVEPTTLRSADNSTMVTGFATNTKQDVEMDETTWQGGVSAQGDGWDQDDPELEELAIVGEDASPHLVDHVPERPESRYGDPSLIVAANPSDMSSHVEDLNQDENNFGPVVDQTPLERVLPPPAVGSTVVAPPSVINDVSDEGDNDGSNAESLRVPNEWEDQIPNPQSGIDAENTREQLVDTVPPPPEHQPIVRDASSEMATVDDKSTLVPADDPKEDEFGPVVDHTPTGQRTNSVESRIGTACPHGDVGDKKTAANMDSVAPIYSLESKEKQDGLDEDEFGPVVDHLPASCSKSSIAPSKGGSTVDALATVSEGDDDLNTRDGWDDDTLDLVDQASPANMSHRANHSVTWEDNVYDSKESLDPKVVNTSNQSNDFGDSTFFTAAGTNTSSQAGLDETKFYDPEESDDMNGWCDNSLNIADDDTPPSTPRANKIFKKSAISDCSTVEKTDELHLETNVYQGTTMEVVKTHDVNLQKLLQEEMAKSLLLEKESEALRTMVDSLKEAKELLLTAAKQHVGREDELMDAILKWQEANGDLTSENGNLSENMFKFQDENKILSEDVLKYKSDNEKLLSENGKVVEDILNFQNENTGLSSENGRISILNRKLSEDVLTVEAKCTDLRGKNDILSGELESLWKSISQLEDEKSEIFAREAAQSAEIANLKNSLEKQLQKSTSDASLREDIRSAQTELSSKVNECSQLNSRLILVEEKLKKSDAQNFKHTKDLAKVTKGHERNLAELQTQIDSRQKDLDELRLSNLKSISDLENRLSSELASNQQLQQEKNSLVQQRNNSQLQLQQSVKANQIELSRKYSEFQSLHSRFQIAQDNNRSLNGQINNYAQQVERFTSISAELESISKEKDVLKEELVDCKAHVASMQKHFNDLTSLIGLNSSKPEYVAEAIQNDRAKQLEEIEFSRNQIYELTDRLNGIESDKVSIQSQFEAYRKSHESSQKVSAASALNVIKEEAKLKKIQGEVQRLRTELQRATNELKNSENECTHLSDKGATLEVELARLGDVAARNSRLQENLARFQREKESQEQLVMNLEHNISDNEKMLLSKEQEIISLREQHRSSQSDQIGIEHEKQHLLVKLEEMNAQVTEMRSERDAYAKKMNARISKLGSERDTRTDEVNARLVELESERDALTVEREEANGQLRKLHDDLQVLSKERDNLLAEKGALNFENEEMLVQFGLLNEQMEERDSETVSMEKEFRILQEERKSHEDKLQDVKNKIKAYQEQLEYERHRHEEQLQAKDEEKNSKEEELKNDLQIAHRMSQKFENELHMSEDKLNSLIRESEEMTMNVGDIDDNTKKLIEVNTALRDKLRAMASEQTAAAAQIQAMESHKLGLNGRVEDLQNLVDNLIASFEAKEGNLQSTIKNIKHEKDEITNQSLNQGTEIAQLRRELEEFKGIAEECTTLRRNVTDMENKLNEQDRQLLQKDAAAEDLYNQLQNIGNMPQTSVEMDMLRGTVQDLEVTVSNDKKQIQELGEMCNQTQHDLMRSREQLKFAEVSAEQLQTDLQSKQEVESTNQMLESRLDQLERELMNARSEETKHRKEATDLKQQITDIQLLNEQISKFSADLEASQRHVKYLEREQGVSSSAASSREQELERQLRSLQDQVEQQKRNFTAELEASRLRIRSLQQEKGDSSSAANAREEDMERQLCSLQDQIAQKDNDQDLSSDKNLALSTELDALRKHVEDLTLEKETFYSAATAREEEMEGQLRLLLEEMSQKDEQIACMETKVQSLDEDLNESKHEADEKQKGVNDLTAKIESLKAMVSGSATARIAEDNNMLSTQLIQLAQAFEISETGRAQLLEKIEKERQQHAESLRRMTVNMKRFYASLNMSHMSDA